jgi:hypothetical protein
MSAATAACVAAARPVTTTAAMLIDANFMACPTLSRPAKAAVPR